MQQLELNQGWQVKQREPASPIADDFRAGAGWLSATVPGTVHQDLLQAGRIPDPFVGLNENAVQWVSDCDWLYRCTFDVPATFLQSDEVALCLDGLDTFAEVWLNGQQVLVSDNMFIPHRLPIKSLLKAGSNELRILFESALRRGQEREKASVMMPVWGDPNYTSRVWVRKAQYHYGWDWGPVLITSGIWRSVRLEAYTARIADVNCPVQVAADLGSVALPIKISVESDTAAGLSAQFTLLDPGGKVAAEATVPINNSTAEHTLTVTSPQLWWPNGYGTQNLYRLTVKLLRGQETLDERQTRIGLRRLRLVQEPLADEPGTSFTFEINNSPIFCGGANWIPADSFTPRVTPEKYRAWLKLAADANMVMLRIWGGGIYEDDAFYDYCDELGLMVWQDFMFACGLYPAPDWLQTSVKAEAEAAVTRLRHHPSIVLWCGNNEDYQVGEAFRVYDPAFNGDFTRTGFPARTYYERILPEVCAALDPTRPYWPGSPYVGKPTVNDPSVGDRHAWDVWHGAGLPGDYHDYPKYAGRFVSEFGMQALPALETIESFTAPEERYPGSRTMEHHNKAGGGPQRLAFYMAGNVNLPGDLEGMINATQFVQSEALSAGYQGWRRRWGGPGRYAVSGVLVWQLDDCWPVTSWAIADSELRPKPACYTIRRLLAPITVGLASAKAGAAIWAVNGTLQARDVQLDLQTWTLDGQQMGSEQRSVALAPNRATELGTVALPTDQPTVLSARLLGQDASVIARATLWPEPFKYYTLPDPGIETKRIDGDLLLIHCARPAKGVWLSASGRVEWSDNMLDLIPGDPQTIKAKGVGDGKINIRWLGKTAPTK